MTTLFGDLQKVGLTENQSVVYLALARAGTLRAGEVIKKTGLHRNIVYTSLEELREQKLIGKSQIRGVFCYKMLSPSRLLFDLKEREQTARLAIEELGHLTKRSPTQEIIVYEGLEEFRRHALRSYNLATAGGMHRYLGSSPRWHSVIGPELEQKLNRIQQRKKLVLRGIAKSSFPALGGYLRSSKGLVDIRINPLISSDTNNVEILEDRICLQSFVEPYFVVEIVNKEVAKNYQNYFDFLWRQSKSR
ncbi:MAG: helix-turn-helix domain-containing protein [Patescibacteria group bacterium]